MLHRRHRLVGLGVGGGAVVTITYHRDLIQGSDEWHALRCGLLTASEIKLIVNIPKTETRVKKDGTPYKQREPSPADDEACRAHLYELLAQRISKYVEPSYISDDMLRGKDDELEARALYAKHHAPVEEVGFIVRDFGNYRIGYSPDGLVGDDGLIECKSRRQKFQVQTIIDNEVPSDFLLQCQTGLLVTGRKWLDFISYSGGLPMQVVRTYPIQRVHDAILEAADAFEARLEELRGRYLAAVLDRRLIPTERRIEEEMYLG